MNSVIEKTMESLERNNMKAYYAENKAQVCEIVKGMLFPGAVITAGGMAIALCLMAIIIILVQQLGAFLLTVVIEIAYR